MRLFVLTLFYLIPCWGIAQQGNPLPVVQQKMAVLDWLAGKWEGTGFLLGEGDRRQEVAHHLEFDLQLNGTMFIINENATVYNDTLFHNKGFLGYDFRQSRYSFLTFTHGGAQNDAYVEVSENTLRWRMHADGHIYKFTAHLDDKGQWEQLGEVSVDEGKSWQPFFKSTLQRVR